MTNYLILSVEATGIDPKTANLQFFTMTACKSSEQNSKQLELTKEKSFFVDIDTSEVLYYVKESKDLFNDNKGFLHPDAYKDLITLTQARAIEIIQKSIEQSDYVIMHSAYNYLIPLLQNKGVDFIGKVVIDTVEHIDYPTSIKTRKLPYLCADYNLLLYPEDQHYPRTSLVNKALMHLINKQNNLDQIIKNALKTFASLFIAIKIDYSQNNRAKELGYFWQPQLKTWAKKGTAADLEAAKNEFGKDNVAIINS